MLNIDENMLLPAIIQDVKTNEVLILGYMNKPAFEKTVSTGLVHFWSRSRQKLWQKGEQSGHTLQVQEILVNCEENSLLVKVVLDGPGACHNGYVSCFYRKFDSEGDLVVISEKSFDTEKVYSFSTTSASNQNVQPEIISQQTFEDLYEKIYGAYRYIHTHRESLSESSTARLLAGGNISFIDSRLKEELAELFGIISGTHKHSNIKDDILLEGSQVCYWLILGALVRDIELAPIVAAKQIFEGYSTISNLPGIKEDYSYIQNCKESEIPQSNNDSFSMKCNHVLAFLGKVCKFADVSPDKVLSYDLMQMQSRNYLKPYFKSISQEKMRSV